MNVSPIVVVDVGFWIAFLHGVLSFFTPCMLPLLPFLFSIATARKSLISLISFVIGFSLTFTVMGAFTAELGSFLPSGVLRIISGILIIVFGALYILNVSLLRSGKLLRVVFDSGEKLPSFVVGISLGLVWIPCSTPVLASILAIAAQSAQRLKGALLLFVYSIGILTPFFGFGWLVQKGLELSSGKLKVFIRVVGGALMISVGILIISGCLNFSP